MPRALSGPAYEFSYSYSPTHRQPSSFHLRLIFLTRFSRFFPFAARPARHGGEVTTHATLENPSKSLAFFVRLKVNKGKGGDEILPVLWQDNYISLLPGEKREVTATYRAQELGTAQPAVEVNGWNVE